MFHCFLILECRLNLHLALHLWAGLFWSVLFLVWPVSVWSVSLVWSCLVLYGLFSICRSFVQISDQLNDQHCTNLPFVSEVTQTLAKSISLITNSGLRVNFTYSCISSTNMWSVDGHTWCLPLRLACPAPVTPAMPWTGFNVQRFLLRIHCSLTDLFRPYLLPFTCRSLD